MPKLLDEVLTPKGVGKVSEFDEVNGRKMVHVHFEQGDRWYNADEVTPQTKAYGY